MKKLLFFGIFSTLFFSCTKEYQYYLIYSSGTEKFEESIKAENDSAAYFKAYSRFKISERFSMNDSILGKPRSIPVDFKLINQDGNDISKAVSYPDNHPSKVSTNEFVDEFIPLENSKIDSAKIKALNPFFIAKKDEFSPNNLTWHTPKSAPKYINQSAFYTYFQTKNGRASNFRLKLQYTADDWLFFRKVQFVIDGKPYELIPTKTETDHGNGRIWEWFDEQITRYDKDLIVALSEAKNAKMKLIGRQYHKERTITASQLRDIKRSFELFEAMGGEIK